MSALYRRERGACGHGHDSKLRSGITVPGSVLICIPISAMQFFELTTIANPSGSRRPSPGPTTLTFVQLGLLEGSILGFVGAILWLSWGLLGSTLGSYCATLVQTGAYLTRTWAVPKPAAGGGGQ